MDIVSHALWGGITFGRRSRRLFLIAAGISLFPDLLSEGLIGVLYIFNIGNLPGWEHGHPNITDFPLWAQNFYNFTHSLVIFTLVFLLIWGIVRRPVWVVGAWGLHILIDILTHSVELFPTPFLWPLSEYTFPGLGWDNPIVLSIDIVLLLGVYSLCLLQRKRN